ncbi:MAG: YqgE/AlgH family protein [Pseudomonadota bacterium]
MIHRRLRALAITCLLALGAAAAHAQAPSGKAVLLVASPALQGLYARTALVAVPVGDRYLGFIVNRATELRLGALFPDHPPSAKVHDPVYLGGPVMSDALFAVVKGNPGAGSLHLFGELFVAAGTEAIDRIIEQTPNDARYFAGFVGWEPGELAREIEAGYWIVSEPDATLFFRPDTGNLWEELVKRPRTQAACAAPSRPSLSVVTA